MVFERFFRLAGQQHSGHGILRRVDARRTVNRDQLLIARSGVDQIVKLLAQRMKCGIVVFPESRALVVVNLLQLLDIRGFRLFGRQPGRQPAEGNANRREFLHFLHRDGFHGGPRRGCICNRPLVSRV